MAARRSEEKRESREDAALEIWDNKCKSEEEEIMKKREKLVGEECRETAKGESREPGRRPDFARLYPRGRACACVYRVGGGTEGWGMSCSVPSPSSRHHQPALQQATRFTTK